MAATRLNKKIAFVGAGTMAFALAKGFTASNHVLPSEIHMLVRNPIKRHLVIGSGYLPVHTPEELTSMDVIFISLSTEEALEFLQLLGPFLEDKKQLVVSLCIGLSVERIDAILVESRSKQGLPVQGCRCRIARLVPNVACQSGSGVSVFCVGEHCTPEDERLLMALLTTCGVSYRVQEGHMDACAAISSSDPTDALSEEQTQRMFNVIRCAQTNFGPAYIFTLLEALSDAGVKNGLTRNVASQLAIDMVEGSAKLASMKAGVSTLGNLKHEVIFPAGSTIMGLAALEEHGFKNAIMKAVEEALVPAEPDNHLF